MGSSPTSNSCRRPGVDLRAVPGSAAPGAGSSSAAVACAPTSRGLRQEQAGDQCRPSWRERKYGT